MRRFRKKREELGVSLFPFLAVLICTFGVLIVLLVMVVKQADVKASDDRKEAADERADAINRLHTELDIVQSQNDSLQTGRPRLVEDLGQARAARGYLLEAIRQLELAQQQLVAELSALEDRSQNDRLDESEFADRQTALNEKIQQTELELAQIREKRTKQEKTTYSIVPYHGGGGTNRRPIFIECDERGVVFQPSGIRLRRDDFVEPFSIGNPLDASLIAIREYWNRNQLGGNEGDPYPLIVVRPGGARSYALARHAMKSWDDEFGYELVPNGLDIDFGDIDQQLNREIETAIEKARLRQKRMVSAALKRSQRLGGTGSSSRRGGLVASGTMGGFVNSKGQLAGDGVDTNRSGFGKLDGEERKQWDESGFSPSSSQPGTAGQQTPGRQSSDSQQASQSESDDNSFQAKSSGAGKPGGSADGNSAMGQATPTTSLASQRGAGWALPTRTPGAIGYVRPIRVRCFADKLVLVESTNDPWTAEFKNETVLVITPLVNRVWQIIEGWGVAGAGSYWKPELLMEVVPGGEQRYAELRQLLDQSGLQIREVVR